MIDTHKADPWGGDLMLTLQSSSRSSQHLWAPRLDRLQDLGGAVPWGESLMDQITSVVDTNLSWYSWICVNEP